METHSPIRRLLEKIWSAFKCFWEKRINFISFAGFSKSARIRNLMELSAASAVKSHFAFAEHPEKTISFSVFFKVRGFRSSSLFPLSRISGQKISLKVSDRNCRVPSSFIFKTNFLFPHCIRAPHFLQNHIKKYKCRKKKITIYNKNTSVYIFIDYPATINLHNDNTTKQIVLSVRIWPESAGFTENGSRVCCTDIK